MAKIAYVGLPAYGHTNPTLPVMKEVVKRGHQVLYYNAASFQRIVSPTGVDFRALPEPMPTERDLSEALHSFINASLIISEISEPLAQFLIDAFGREKPELVIYDSVAMWGYIAARTHGIPHVCFITTFVLDGSESAIGLKTMGRFLWSALPKIPKLLKWRRRMGRRFGKDISAGITDYGDLNIVFTSKLFHPPNTFVDDRFRFVGPAIDPKTRNGRFPFNQLRHGPKVYISLGTVNHLDNDFYQTAFTAFADYPAQFILSIGKNSDLAQLGVIPHNFIVRHFVPQLDMLQRVDAFITHGGMNSVHEGLYYGVPEIVVPHQFEQLLNGKRVAQTEAGLLLGDKRPYGRVTPQELRKALNAVLNDAHYRRNAERIGKTLREAGGTLRVVDELETFMNGKRSPEKRSIL